MQHPCALLQRGSWAKNLERTLWVLAWNSALYAMPRQESLQQIEGGPTLKNTETR